MGTLVAASALIRLWFNSHIHMQHLDQRKDMLSEGEQALVCLDAWLQLESCFFCRKKKHDSNRKSNATPLALKILREAYQRCFNSSTLSVVLRG